MTAGGVALALAATLGATASAVAAQGGTQASETSPLYNASQDAGVAAVAFDGAPRQGGLVRGRAQGLAGLTLDGRAVPVSSDGAFLIGFDRDAPATAVLLATFSNGETRGQRLNVARRAWPTRKLATLRRGAPRTPQAIAARAAEVARIDAARAGLQPVEGWRQRFRWPVVGRISGVFGAQTIYAGEPGGYHSGVDVARPSGTPVVAPAEGIVVLASPPRFSLEGNLLVLDHGMGLSSAFVHLSRIDVAVGSRVRQGQLLGAVGATGRATGPHLHWSVVWRGARIDPQPLAEPMPDAT